MEQEIEELDRRLSYVIEHADKVAPEKLIELTEELRKLNELLEK